MRLVIILVVSALLNGRITFVVPSEPDRLRVWAPDRSVH